MSQVEVTALCRKNFELFALAVHKRWPNNIKEWCELLHIAVQISAVEGLVKKDSIFAGVKTQIEVPETIGLLEYKSEAVDTAGLKYREGTALMLLHAPQDGVGNGTLLLPGVPHLGLDHRACWVKAEQDGTVHEYGLSEKTKNVENIDLLVLKTALM